MHKQIRRFGQASLGAVRRMLRHPAATVVTAALAFAPVRTFAAKCGIVGLFTDNDCQLKAIGSIIGVVVDALTYIVAALSWFFGLVIKLISKILEPFIIESNRITSLPEIQGMWSMMRDLANALLILVLIAAALLVIIRYEKGNYTVKQVLPKVISAVLLINFSKLIIQVIVDAAHVLATGIYQMLGGTGIVEEKALLSLYEGMRIDQMLTTISYAQNQVQAGLGSGANNALSNAQLFVAVLLVAVLVFTIMVSTVSVLILFASRIIALGLLTIVSPLAILASILPPTQEYAKKFWSQLVKYAFIPTVLAVYFAFAIRISTMFARLSVDIDKNSAAFQSQMSGLPDIQWSTLINIIITLMIIKAGVKAAKNGTFAESVIDNVETTANKYGKQAAAWTTKKATAPVTKPVATFYRNRVANVKARLDNSKDKFNKWVEEKQRDPNYKPYGAVNYLASVTRTAEESDKAYKGRDSYLKARYGGDAYSKPEANEIINEQVKKDQEKLGSAREIQKEVASRSRKGFRDTQDAILNLKLLAQVGIDGTDAKSQPKVADQVLQKILSEKDYRAFTAETAGWANQDEVKTQLIRDVLENGKGKVKDATGTEVLSVDEGQGMKLGKNKYYGEIRATSVNKRAEMESTAKTEANAVLAEANTKADFQRFIDKDISDDQVENEVFGSIEALAAAIDKSTIADDDKYELVESLATKIAGFNQARGADEPKIVSDGGVLRLQTRKDLMKLLPQLAGVNPVAGPDGADTNLDYYQGAAVGDASGERIFEQQQVLRLLEGYNAQEIRTKLKSDKFKALYKDAVNQRRKVDTLAGDTSNTNVKVVANLASSFLPKDGEPIDAGTAKDLVKFINSFNLEDRMAAAASASRVVNKPELLPFFKGTTLDVEEINPVTGATTFVGPLALPDLLSRLALNPAQHVLR